MGLNRFIYDKVVRQATIEPSPSWDYHPQYPIENVRDFWSSVTYRSRYGIGSGWGHFYIDVDTNKIDFNEGSGELTAVVSIGSFDAYTLATAIQNALNSAGTLTYTVSYSDTTNKFTISASGTFSLLWKTGTNSAQTIGGRIGFDVSADDTGQSSYVADSPRIHTYVMPKFTLSSAISSTCCVIFGLNLTSSYQIFSFERWTGSSWLTIGNFLYDASKGKAIIFYDSISSESYRIVVRDWENPDGYAEIGAVLLGDYVRLSKLYDYGYTGAIEDMSTKEYSKEGYVSITTQYLRKSKAVSYELLKSDFNLLMSLYDTVGGHLPIGLVEDDDNILDSLSYVLLDRRLRYRGVDAYFTEVDLSWEELR